MSDTKFEEQQQQLSFSSSSFSSTSSPWTYYNLRSERLLMKFGRNGIVVGEDGRTKTVVKLGETASQGGEEDGCYSLYTRSRFLWDTTEVIPTSSLSLNNDVAVDESQRRIVRSGNLSVVLSAIYFIFIVTVGVVIGVADLILPETNIGEVFSIYLLVPGLAWYVVLHADLLRHGRSVTIRSNRSSTEDAGYIFLRGRHSGSFFLKIGAAGFCFGHLIHSCLMLGRQILHFTSEDPVIREECADVTVLILYLLLPVYSFYQLFLLFKYSNVMINRWKELARFGVMHSMATSLFFWFWLVRNETMDSLHHHQLTLHKKESSSGGGGMPYLMNITHPVYGKWMLWNFTGTSSEKCASGGDFSALILHVSPYLYPFSIEYSILVVGIWFIMWQNIGQVPQQEYHYNHHHNEAARLDVISLRNHLVIQADCDSANRGLFAGLVVMVATAISIIVFFLAFSDERYVAAGIWIGLVSESTLLILMIVAAGLACRQLGRLMINEHPVSQLDDLLLFVCIPSFFLYGIFSIVPAMAYSNYMALFVAVLQVAQVILQTPLIIDGLRRCSPSNPAPAEHKCCYMNKPGRELITFLIVCNLSMWIMETFEIKSYETHSDRIRFYGHPLWTLLSHVTLPLTLFYRFHSASCLVDIWKSAYQPPDS